MSHNQHARILAVALLCLAPTLVGCQPQQRRRAPEPEPVAIDERVERPFYEGTDRMQTELDELFAQIPSTSGRQRIELGQRIVAYGEPATPRLIETLQSEDATLRVFAAWLLGLMRDTRALDALETARSDPDESVRFEVATTMVRLGDKRGLSTLVDGLSHPDPRVRSRAIRVLEQETGSTFGFRADDHKDDREPAVARWREWLDKNRRAVEIG